MKYLVQSTDGKLSIPLTTEPNKLFSRLNQISKTVHLATLIITSEEKTFTWTYNKAVDVREQLETLIVQNFKDAWEEGFSQHIEELMEQGCLEVDETWLRSQDWSDARAMYLQDYMMNLEKLIVQNSGLFQ